MVDLRRGSTLVTTYGVRDNEHARGLVTQSVTIDALFARQQSVRLIPTAGDGPKPKRPGR